MKLLIAVVNKRDARSLREALVSGGFRFTEMGSTGGFLREGNVTLLIGVAEEEVENVLTLVRELCHTREEMVNVISPSTRVYAHPIGEAVPVPVGGAKVFVVSVEQFLQL